MEPKLLSYEEYCKALTNDPTPNFLHGLIVEFSDGRLEPFTMQFGPLYDSEYGHKFRVWDVNRIYRSIRDQSKNYLWADLENNTLCCIIKSLLRSMKENKFHHINLDINGVSYVVREIYDDTNACVKVYQLEYNSNKEIFYARYQNTSPEALLDSLTLEIYKKLKDVVNNV